jgi:hypothetical protein
VQRKLERFHRQGTLLLSPFLSSVELFPLAVGNSMGIGKSTQAEVQSPTNTWQHNQQLHDNKFRRIGLLPGRGWTNPPNCRVEEV